MHSHPVIDREIVAEARQLRALAGGRASGAEPAEPSDEQVIHGLLHGETWAADALYDRLEAAIERTLRRILQSADAEYDDLVQITFERIVRTLIEQKFSGACSLSTWASAIAGHVGIDALRARVRERGVFSRARNGSPALTPDVAGPNLEKQLEARSEIEQLQHILATMKPDQAKTVVLHDALGHELSEIAVMTGVSVAAAQSRLVRGRKELLRRAGPRLRRGR